MRMFAVPWHVRDPSRRKLTTRLNELSRWEKRVLNQTEDLFQSLMILVFEIRNALPTDAMKGITVIFFFSATIQGGKM
jgi:hypothetical protein